MTDHTPTPWRVNGAAIWAADKSGYVAELSSPRGADQRDIDAAFIVKAVNNHLALVEALQKIASLEVTGGAAANLAERVLNSVGSPCK